MDKYISLKRFTLFLMSLWTMGTAFMATAKEPVTVALVYTVTTPELKRDVVKELRAQIGSEARLLTYEVPEAFNTIKQTGFVTAKPAAQMVGTYMQATEEGADVILSICSTVEDIAYSAQSVARYTGIPIIMVNEEMCREAVCLGSRVAIVSTFETSLAPTRNTLARVARESNRRIEIHEVLVKGGFGMEGDRLKAYISNQLKEVANQVDVILFTQGSMAYCEAYIEKQYDKEVLTNPYYSAKAVKEALQRKGLLK